MRTAATPGTVAVLGGAGKTGRAVCAALRDLAVAPRPVVRPWSGSPSPREAVAADLADADELTGAILGCDAVYVIAPNLHPDEVHLVHAALTAARRAEVGRVVYHSVLRPGIRAMPHHWRKLEAEELVWNSGLPATVVQPSAYAQNLLAALDDQTVRVPYSVDVPFSLVDLQDVAAAAALVLTAPGHLGATYELSGPVTTVADLARTTGRTAVQVQAPPAGDTYSGRALRAMFDWYDAHGLAGSPTVLTMLLGRPPREAAQVLGAGSAASATGTGSATGTARQP